MLIIESIRSIKRDWQGSVIRVISLTMGLTVFMLTLIVFLLSNSGKYLSIDYFMMPLVLFGILLVTCISYTLISYNFSYNRKREVFIHRLYGASKFRVFMLLQCEHLLLVLIAALFSLAILDQFLLNFVGYFVIGKDLHNLSSYPILMYIIGIGIGVMVLCGSIPNLMLINRDTSHILEKICFKK